MPFKSNSTKLTEQINAQSEGFRSHFWSMKNLLKSPHPTLPAILAYHFHIVETAHHRAFYGILCINHKADPDLVRSVLDNQNIKREQFEVIFANVAGEAIDGEALKKLKLAEKVRDRMIHGKSETDANLWKAIFSLFDYSVAFNGRVRELAGFEPFGDMRGKLNTNRASRLNAQTTRWVLKGMQFAVG